MTESNKPSETPRLRRQLNLLDAIGLGLGSIIGTGIFFSLGLAAELAGSAFVWALPLAAVVAAINALNSAQLAAAYPVSGGTYEYGYRLLNPFWGFQAGWMFLCAKTASAATAALGFSSYLLGLSGGDPAVGRGLAIGVSLVISVAVVCGVKLSSRINLLMILFVLTTLAVMVFVGFFLIPPEINVQWGALVPANWPGFWEATALLFVAYTGYGRIATLGEEVVTPERTIPRAIITTLICAAVVYVAVGMLFVFSVGAHRLGTWVDQGQAPLALLAESWNYPALSALVSIGALVAMLSVSLNLQLGLSRVLLAMARRHDMPTGLQKLNGQQTSPTYAVIAVGTLIIALLAIGNVRTTWSFSAVTVLIYYSITNLAAWYLPIGQRRYPRFLAGLGIAVCLSLAWWVDSKAWLLAVIMIAVGRVWQLTARRLAARRLAAGRPARGEHASERLL